LEEENAFNNTLKMKEEWNNWTTTFDCPKHYELLVRDD
jgi:hypothetical protein